jgi:20S proteasome alpha/beta subunit
MTIAAGFNLKDFVVMFSDTEYTKGNTVYDGPKLFPKHDYPTRVATCFAIAGSVPNARQAIRKIEEEIGNIKASRVSQNAVIDAVETTLQPIYDRLRKRQDYWSEGGPQFYLLMSITAAGTTKLYANYEDVVNEVQEREFVGTGEDFARYITTPIFESDMSLPDAIGLANYALTITKQNVASCGKRSQIVVISKEHGLPVVLPEDHIRELEKTQMFLQEHVQKMIFWAMVPGEDKEKDTFKARADLLLEAVEQIRKRKERTRDAYLKLKEEMKIDEGAYLKLKDDMERGEIDPATVERAVERLERLDRGVTEATRLWIETAFIP